MTDDERGRQSLHEQNRRSWNRATAAHNSHKGQVEAGDVKRLAEKLLGG